MKRTDTLTRVVSLLLFVALLAYMGFYVFRSFSKDDKTVSAVYVSLAENAPANGIILRNEEVIISDKPYINLVAEHGSLLAAGDSIAAIYSSQDALDQAGRIKELEAKLAYLKDALNNKEAQLSLPQRERATKTALRKLCASSARQDVDGIAQALPEIAALAPPEHKPNVTPEEYNSVAAELSSLKLAAGPDIAEIKADKVGLWSSGIDGFENFTPESIAALGVDEIKALSTSKPEVTENAIGKICSPYEWYFAAVMDSDSAARLEIGSSIELNMGRYCSHDLSASVISVSEEKGGNCKVVFRSTEASSELLPVRFCEAQVVFGSKEGIRVPKEAVSKDEKGSYVFTRTAMKAEKKYIDILWEEEEFYLAAVSPEATALRVGNEIFLSSKELYDGMLIK